MNQEPRIMHRAIRDIPKSSLTLILLLLIWLGAPPVHAAVPPPPPNQPTGLTPSSISSSEIDLAWSSVANATGFYVYQSPNGSSSWNQIANITNGSAISYQNTSGLSAGTPYYYYIIAYNSGGNSTQSSTVSDYTRPIAPTLSAFTNVSNTSVQVNWG